eukprot:c18559_g2_i3 orf=3-977(-)
MGIFQETSLRLIAISLGLSSCLYRFATAYHQQDEIQGLTEGFYQKSCPNLEEIVKSETTAIYNIHGNAAVSFLRNIFHDCACQGCDASILLDPTLTQATEKQSDTNFGMRNFKYVDRIKAAVEQQCPNTVSCADILILSGRDGIVLLGGPYIPMKTGRRDSLSSSKEAADASLLPANADISNVLDRFSSMGLNIAHTVALLGGHTVGRTHCKNLVQRLYPTVDQTLNPEYAGYLKQRCPSPHPDPTAVEYARNDRVTPMGFDNQYYKNVIQKKGLLRVDTALILDPRTSDYVIRMASNNSFFFEQFVEAMEILTVHNPLTGSQGE